MGRGSVTHRRLACRQYVAQASYDYVPITLAMPPFVSWGLCGWEEKGVMEGLEKRVDSWAEVPCFLRAEKVFPRGEGRGSMSAAC